MYEELGFFGLEALDKFFKFSVSEPLGLEVLDLEAMGKTKTKLGWPDGSDTWMKKPDSDPYSAHFKNANFAEYSPIVHRSYGLGVAKTLLRVGDKGMTWANNTKRLISFNVWK